VASLVRDLDSSSEAGPHRRRTCCLNRRTQYRSVRQTRLSTARVVGPPACRRCQAQDAGDAAAAASLFSY